MTNSDVGQLLTRKRILWFLGVLLAVWLLAFLMFAPAYYSSLGLPMKVHLDRPADAIPIRAVWITTDYRRHPRMDSLLAHTKDPTTLRKSDLDLAEPLSFSHGHPLDIRIPGSDSGSMLGITLTYSQHRVLLVLAELADGRRVGTIAEIPDARTTREMRVTLP